MSVYLPTAGIDRILSQSPGSHTPYLISSYKYARTEPPPHDLPQGTWYTGIVG